MQKHEAPLQALGRPGLSPLGHPLRPAGGSAAAAFQDASLDSRLHSHGLLQAYQQVRSSPCIILPSDSVFIKSCQPDQEVTRYYP